MFLAAFHQIVENWGWRKWCEPFVWIGMNPITVYLAINFMDFEELVQRVVGGPVKEAFGSAGPLVIAVSVVIVMFAFVRFLYKRQIFLRL